MKIGILQNACSTSQKMGADLGKSALMYTARFMNSLAKRSQKNDDKSAVAMLTSTRQSGCVSQDMEPPKSTSILRKSSNMRKPIRCVKFTKAVVRHAVIRDQDPSLGMICPGAPHQRNPNAPYFVGLRKRRNGKSDMPVKLWRSTVRGTPLLSGSACGFSPRHQGRGR